jgi:type III pantothenate kinase
MNLVIDYGNTRIKAGLFESARLHDSRTFLNAEDLSGFLQGFQPDHLIISSVSGHPEKILSHLSVKGKKIILTSNLPLPLKITYQTPATLGVDRLAAACGAWELFPGKHTLVVDAGTCINYELVEASGTYRGGAISPGIAMRFEAMHTFTARLPLLFASTDSPLIGDSTEACMQSGVLNGVLSEVSGMIQRYETLYPGLQVILCGGDNHFFENNLKQPIFVAPDLVLRGLNSILRYHVD